MDSIKKLTDIFAKFPSIGPRTASRFAFYLINLPKQEIDELVLAIQSIKNNIALCMFCFQPFEKIGQAPLCPICSDTTRNSQILCVVEKEKDLLSIESTKKYKGLYFILGGVVTFRNPLNPNIRIEQLKERIILPQKFGLSTKAHFSEVIIATNPTIEGNATSQVIEKALREISLSPAFKITHLARGLPMGGELEYADEETLESAFEGRK